LSGSRKISPGGHFLPLKNGAIVILNEVKDLYLPEKRPDYSQTPHKETVMQVETCLFAGRCEEVLEFCLKALGAEVTMFLRYKETRDPDTCPT
jgi:hypothetical protein